MKYLTSRALFLSSLYLFVNIFIPSGVIGDADVASSDPIGFGISSFTIMASGTVEQIAVSEILKDAVEYDSEWFSSAWFGWFTNPGLGWIYHLEHGWLTLSGKNTTSFFIYDQALQTWCWASKSSYPWIYYFDPVNSWTFYDRGGRPGQRWFYRANVDKWLKEADLLQSQTSSKMVVVEGGTIGTLTVDTFNIGRTEVTWGDWQTVRIYAAANGYDIGSRGEGCAEDHPVHSVAWYDVIKWCNAKSEMERLKPVYTVSGEIYRSGELGYMDDNWNWVETALAEQDLSADGYRLPLESEWEFAARGGNESNGYTYAGSNDLKAVGWYQWNSRGAECELWYSNGTWPVGHKKANELGLYDMSGNVWEWCWDAVSIVRLHRGGSWNDEASECFISYRSGSGPDNRLFGSGFRLVRRATPPIAQSRIISLSGDLQFGDLTVNQTLTRTLVVSNMGNSILTVSGITYPAGFSGNWSSEKIASGGSQKVTVTFAPTTTKNYGGQITVNSDATVGTINHAVNGTGIAITAPAGMVLVQGGTLAMSMGTRTVHNFYIAETEVTWGDWQTVRIYAAANGYDIGSSGDSCAEDYPVHSVTWYDVIKWCNAKSEMEGLASVYMVSGGIYRSGESDEVVSNLAANGYRLPLEEEWEFAARGGNQSNGYTYAGSNDLKAVGWYGGNSSGSACGDIFSNGTWPVGQKAANELGLYDMTGNVWEWCWDRRSDISSYRRFRGGSWGSSPDNCTLSFRPASTFPDRRDHSFGFRPARSE